MLKFWFDRIVALIGLLLLWPVLLIIYIINKFDDPTSPGMYTQMRVGKDGKLFEIYKFRTMVVGYDSSSISIAGQASITPLGAVLRRYKLDELPELWNVLKGDMSFVGPRPDVPGYADSLKGSDREILKLRPGITGPATLKYRAEEELLAQVDNPYIYNDEVIYPDKVKINRYYLHNYSFMKDLQMIFCTVLHRHMHYNGEVI